MTARNDVLRAGAAITAVPLVAVALAVPALSAEDRALTLIRAYNARDVGAPGWRRVTIDLSDGPTITDRFTVINVWRRSADGAEMLFFLESPNGLRGTAYRQEERVHGDRDLSVQLWLPTSRRVLAVESSNLGEGLLGSDFSYEDFRLQMRTDGCEYRVAGTSHLLDTPVTVVRATRAAAEGRWRRADLYLRDSDGFLLGADYFGRDGTLPEKRFRVERLGRRDGVWTAERMTMTHTSGRRTTVSLLEAGFHVQLPAPAAFAPEDLPHLQVWLESIRKKIAAGQPR